MGGTTGEEKEGRSGRTKFDGIWNPLFAMRIVYGVRTSTVLSAWFVPSGLGLALHSFRYDDDMTALRRSRHCSSVFNGCLFTTMGTLNQLIMVKCPSQVGTPVRATSGLGHRAGYPRESVTDRASFTQTSFASPSKPFTRKSDGPIPSSQISLPLPDPHMAPTPKTPATWL